MLEYYSVQVSSVKDKFYQMYNMVGETKQQILLQELKNKLLLQNMCETVHLFTDTKSPLAQWLCLLEFTSLAIENGQIVQSGSHLLKKPNAILGSFQNKSENKSNKISSLAC